jgi:hypothetical protein
VASTSAVLFLGTPHRGSGYAPLGDTLRRVVSAFGFDTNDRNIRALRFDSPELELSREEFLRLWRRRNFTVRTFQEAQGLTLVKAFSDKVPHHCSQSPSSTTLTLIPTKVVPDYSSSLDDPRERAQHLPGNHMSMCRFTSRQDPGYGKIVGELQGILTSLVQSAPSQTVEALEQGIGKSFP